MIVEEKDMLKNIVIFIKLGVWSGGYCKGM